MHICCPAFLLSDEASFDEMWLSQNNEAGVFASVVFALTVREVCSTASKGTAAGSFAHLERARWAQIQGRRTCPVSVHGD